jgi:hypothetical protein
MGAPPAAILLVVLLPLGIMALGFGIGAVQYRADLAGADFATGLWPRDCRTLRCDAEVKACMDDPALSLPTQVLVVLWITSGVWHLLALGLFAFGVNSEHHLRNFGTALGAGLVLSTAGVGYATFALMRSTCLAADGQARTLHDLGHGFGHLFRIFCTDVPILGALLVGTVCVALRSAPKEDEDNAEERERRHAMEMRAMAPEEAAALGGVATPAVVGLPGERWAEPADPPQHADDASDVSDA